MRSLRAMMSGIPPLLDLRVGDVGSLCFYGLLGLLGPDFSACPRALLLLSEDCS